MNAEIMEGRRNQMRGQMTEWSASSRTTTLKESRVCRNPSSYVDLGGPRSLNDREEEATHVRQTFRFMPVLAMLVALTIGCTAISGKSASENVDDAKITASVKTKLAEEKVATLTKVDVDTNKGTVYLTGNVENAAIKARATQIAYEVSGVREVVNNLKIQ